MNLKKLFQKNESLVSIDIGASSVKLIELDLSGSKPRLINVAVSPMGMDIFANNAISKPDKVSEKIAAMLESNSINDKRAATAMPGPSVFTKKIKMPKLGMAELSNSVQFEAGNFIPHNVDAVKLDFHVLGEAGKNQLDVLVVAVKNEIIDSFVNTLALAGLETAVVDVDYFAMQNVFELGYPELIPSTVALVNIGTRYSSINICRNGESLFTGNIALGGKQFSDAIAEGLGVQPAEAEELKRNRHSNKTLQDAVQDIMDRNIEYVAGEFNRQLSFFWNASGADEGIDKIIITGGGSLVPGLMEELAEKVGIECMALDPFKGIECGSNIDQAFLKEISAAMSVCVGMGLRQPGDKEVPDYL
jgi:type IV pilus assembly protein PilM